MESKKYPLISIGVPTYNRNIGIRKTLESIWQQQYPNLEVIISDNCSTDNTKEVIEDLCKGRTETKYYRQETNIGMIPNFEFLLRKSSGKYFMWASDDDELEPGILFKYVDFLEANPEYSLASGEIKYDSPDFNERGFTFEQKSPSVRVINYYFKVVYGGMIHGMMRKELTKDVPLHKVIGNDYHFIANLAYLGKIKNFEFIGYRKNFGGTSKSFKEYAKAMGESKFAGNFPHLKMSSDAFVEVMYKSRVYSTMPLFSKLTLAVFSFSGVLLCYYVKIFPFTIAGKMKRLIMRPFKTG